MRISQWHVRAKHEQTDTQTLLNKAHSTHSAYRSFIYFEFVLRAQHADQGISLWTISCGSKNDEDSNSFEHSTLWRALNVVWWRHSQWEGIYCWARYAGRRGECAVLNAGLGNGTHSGAARKRAWHEMWERATGRRRRRVYNKIAKGTELTWSINICKCRMQICQHSGGEFIVYTVDVCIHMNICKSGICYSCLDDAHRYIFTLYVAKCT